MGIEIPKLVPWPEPPGAGPGSSGFPAVTITLSVSTRTEAATSPSVEGRLDRRRILAAAFSPGAVVAGVSARSRPVSFIRAGGRPWRRRAARRSHWRLSWRSPGPFRRHLPRWRSVLGNARATAWPYPPRSRETKRISGRAESHTSTVAASRSGSISTMRRARDRRRLFRSDTRASRSSHRSQRRVVSAAAQVIGIEPPAATCPC
jgi:hypothetical protein